MAMHKGLSPSEATHVPSMENHKQKSGWMSVPRFGGWDQKNKGMDYSRIFSRARANKKQKKNEVEGPKIAREEEFISLKENEDCSTKRKRLLGYLHSCLKA